MHQTFSLASEEAAGLLALDLLALLDLLVDEAIGRLPRSVTAIFFFGFALETDWRVTARVVETSCDPVMTGEDMRVSSEAPVDVD